VRIAKILLIVLLTAVLINFVRDGADFPLPHILPGCDGLPLSPIHFLAGAVLLFLMLWGLKRLRRSSDDTETYNTKPDYTDDLQDSADDYDTYKDTDAEEG
jgi:hypothetical protein